MGQIREELVLCDRFTNTFTSYIRLGEQAARTTDTAKRSVKQFSEAQETAKRATDGLAGSLKKLVGAYAGLQGIKLLVGLSDEITATTARLDLMNDGLQTTEELTDKVWQAAQRSRGSYQQTADMVAKLGTLAGDAFSGNDEVVHFAEQINKHFSLSGTNAAGAAAAMLQLTQAMSSGTLRGEELNSILEQAPTIAQSIARYMGVTTGEMRALASEGLVTAEVVKNAIFAAAQDTVDAAGNVVQGVNSKFESMPMTWSQVFTSAGNVAIKALEPLLSAINWLANNIETIGPLVVGAAAAFVVFQVAANWTKIAAIVTGVYNTAVNFLSIGFGVLTGNTAAASAAVHVFNSALLANPITWVVMLIMVLVGVLYAAVAAFNHFSGESVSATGIIAGTFTALLAHILNTFVIPVQNQLASFGNFLGNLFNDPVAAVKVLFFDMAETLLGYIKTVAHGIEDLINKIPGVSVNLTSGIDSIYNKVKDASAKVKSESEWKEYFKKWDYIDLKDAFSMGYDWASNLFEGDGEAPKQDEIPTYEQMAGLEKSVKGIEKAVSMSEEELKSLVDVAERRYVNNVNLTAQTPVINISGQNTGRTEEDRRNLADTIRDILIEQAASGSVRTTARAF